MLKLAAAGVLFAVVSSAQAMPLAPMPQLGRLMEHLN